MKSNYVILPQNKLIIECYNGVLNLQNISLHKMELVKDSTFSSNYDLISDVRDALIDVTLNDVSQYIESMKQMGTLGQRRTATLVDTANQKAYALAFNKLKSTFPQAHNFSSNLDDLLEWLEIPEQKQLVIDTLIDMKKETRFNWKP